MLNKLFINFCKEKKLSWYEVFDSELFEEFISLNNVDTLSQEYKDFYNELYWDL